MSDVCGVRVRNGFQDVTATGAEHHSMLSTRAKISSLCPRGVGKDQNIMEKVALGTSKTATEESTVSLSEVVLRRLVDRREEDTSSGAELARREIDEMTSRVR